MEMVSAEQAAGGMQGGTFCVQGQVASLPAGLTGKQQRSHQEVLVNSFLLTQQNLVIY